MFVPTAAKLTGGEDINGNSMLRESTRAVCVTPGGLSHLVTIGVLLFVC
jgi:hypothetical protein